MFQKGGLYCTKKTSLQCVRVHRMYVDTNSLAKGTCAQRFSRDRSVNYFRNSTVVAWLVQRNQHCMSSVVIEILAIITYSIVCNLPSIMSRGKMHMVY